MVFVIAEAGVNHNGNVELAHALIDAAADAGADAVKFQTFTAELDPPGPRREALRPLILPLDAYGPLKSHAQAIGLEFISSPFDVESLRFLVDEVGVNTIKIASGQHDNWPLLRAAKQSGLDVILSTGMTTLHEVRRALHRLQNVRVTLHCVSAYPCPTEEANVQAIATMARYFGILVGYSDHTIDDPAIPGQAVALGATVIEKHLTLDRSMDGPDHRASLEPHEFTAMVVFIKNAMRARGNGIKEPRDCEANAMQIAMERKAWREKQQAA